MAVTGAATSLEPPKLMSATSASPDFLIRELGSTQHLDRERSRLKLRASLRDTGAA